MPNEIERREFENLQKEVSDLERRVSVIDEKLSQVKESFADLKTAFSRAMAIAGGFAFLILAVTGVTVWQLPARIQQASIDLVHNDVIKEYRDIAQKASTDAKIAADNAGKDQSVAHTAADEIEKTKTKYQAELAGWPAVEQKVAQLENEIKEKASESEVASLKEALDGKVSLDHPYRIRNKKQQGPEPVFLAINNQAVFAAGLSLGDKTHNPNEEGLFWSVVEDW
jgi:hypothetical protein